MLFLFFSTFFSDDSIFNVHSLTLGFESVFASPEKFVNQNVSWFSLHDLGLFTGRIFSREFDNLVADEAFNISVNGGSALVPLSRQLKKTLQEMCHVKLLGLHPLVGSIEVDEVAVEGHGFNRPNIKQNDLVLYVSFRKT